MKVLSSGLLMVLVMIACSKKNNSPTPPPVSGDTTGQGGNMHPVTHGYFVDSNFKPTGNFISLAAVQKDGKIIIANPNGIGRINRDGTKDNSFTVGSVRGGKIHCIALQDNGQVLVGGSFLTFNGANKKYLVRLNQDGSLDNAIAPNIIENGNIQENIASIAVMKDGRILIGGDFFWYIGNQNIPNAPYNRGIICLRSDGAVDTTWKDSAPRSGYYLPYAVDAITVQPDGKILVAGPYFNDARGKTYSDIVRFSPDQTIDSTFVPDFVPHEIQDGIFVYSCLVPLKDGSLMVGGGFNQAAFNNGTKKAVGGYVKLTSNGKFDPSFTYPYAGSIVDAICSLSDSTIFLGDRTDSTASKTYRVRLAVIQPDGSFDANFTIKPTLTMQVYTIVKETDSTVLVAGQMGPDQYQNGYPVYTQGIMRIVRR